MRNLIKKPFFIISLIIIAALIGGYLYFGRSKKPTYDFVIAEKKDLIQEVSVTGHIKPATSVDLAFEISGKVSNLYVKIGDKVKTNQILVELNSTELLAQLKQQEAGLQSAKAQLKQYQAALGSQQAKLEELKKGTRPEEIQIAETEVLNSQKELADAEINLEKVKNKAQADLQEDYQSALAAVQKSVSVGENSLLVLTDIQYAHFNKSDQESSNLAEAKATAVYELLGSQNAGRSTTEVISTLTGGAFGIVENAVNNPTYENIDLALSKTASALQKVKLALETIPIIPELTTTERTNITTEKTNINTEISNISTKEQAISVQKTTNATNITTAEASVNSAKNTLASAQDELKLKKAGSTPEQITAQEAQVRQAEANIVSQEAQIKQAEANVLNYQAKLAKTIIVSPIDGIVTKQEAKIGEIVSANTPIVSLISASQFEIEANLPEADIAKIKINNPAQVTLDAYGNEVIFETKVIFIDPAETIIEGVATYKIKLQFNKEDERLKSGMTANIDILTDKRENVLNIPGRAVMTKNGDKIVKILNKDGIIKEVKVKTGLAGSDGNIEIIEGVNEGDKVITFFKEE